jgi:hypothetical protein
MRLLGIAALLGALVLAALLASRTDDPAWGWIAIGALGLAGGILIARAPRVE